MPKNTMIATFLVLALALGPGAAVAGSGYDLFQKALVKERAEGNLEEAIRLYQRIAREFADDHALAAKALVQLGHCHEKLGDSEARKAYERVLRDYADQNEAVTEARTRLAGLTQPAGSNNHGAMTVRRVWAGPDVDTEGAVSPDGKYLTYVDWGTGDLAIRDLATGEKRRLTNKGSGFQSTDFAESSVISPDSKQVAYAWFNKNNIYDLRLMGLDGSKPRILYSNSELDYLLPCGWAPDGKHIVALLSTKERTNRIALISDDDGSARVLKSFDWRSPFDMRFSPDGRYIAYDFPPSEDSPNRDIFLLAADGTREVPIVQHPANDVLLGWAPDGRRILFASDRTGTMGLWAIEVLEGRPQGPPELIRSDIGKVMALGFTRHGSFYYGVNVGAGDVYIANIDPPSGKVIAAPRPATSRFVGSNSAPNWSPNGEYLAWVSQRGFVPNAPHNNTLCVRSLETGEERDLWPKLNYIFQSTKWSPDTISIVVSGVDPKGRQGIFRVDTKTAQVTTIALAEPGAYLKGPPNWSADGKKIFFVRSDRESDRIVERSLETGQEKELLHVGARTSRFDWLALAPDGRQLAFLLFDTTARSTRLRVVPVAGGEPRELFRTREPETLGPPAWTPDSHQLLFAKSRAIAREPASELWQIPAEGGEPQSLGLAMDNLWLLSVHPDGQRIAFSSGSSKAEVWVMENFLPTLSASR